MLAYGDENHMIDYGLKIIFNYIHGKYVPATLVGAEFLENEQEVDVNEFFSKYMNAPYPFPEDLYLMKKNKVLKCNINFACKFNQIRKVLNSELKIMDYKNDGTSILGSEKAPLSID
jgi:hypothetical protein